MTIITSLLMLGRRGPGVKQASFPPALDTTLGDIPGISQADPRYVDLAFLGAHDANTGRTIRGAKTEPAASGALKKFEPIVRNYLARYVQTQTATIYDLLRYGCRFLHIKVTFCDGIWHTSHSILTGKLETHILDILRFLSERENAGEIVSILFQPIWMDTFSFADLHEYIATIRYKSKNLYDYVHYSRVDGFHTGKGDIRVGDLRYNDVVGKDKENGVVFFERRDQHCVPSWDARETSYPYYFDMDTNALHVWHDHSNVRLLDKGIDETTEMILATDKYNDLLRMNQTQPSSSFKTFSDALSSIYSRSLLKTAEKHNLSLIEKPSFDAMLSAMPVFQVDYLTSGHGDFNRRVNLAIRKYNEKLVKASLD